MNAFDFDSNRTGYVDWVDLHFRNTAGTTATQSGFSIGAIGNDHWADLRYLIIANTTSASTGAISQQGVQMFAQRNEYKSGSNYDDIWESVFSMCDLFHALALSVAEHFGFTYRQHDDENGMREYLRMEKENEC